MSAHGVRTALLNYNSPALFLPLAYRSFTYPLVFILSFFLRHLAPLACRSLYIHTAPRYPLFLVSFFCSLRHGPRATARSLRSALVATRLRFMLL